MSTINYSTLKRCVDALSCHWVTSEGPLLQCKAFFKDDGMLLRRETKFCDGNIQVFGYVSKDEYGQPASGCYTFDLSALSAYMQSTSNLLLPTRQIASAFGNKVSDSVTLPSDNNLNNKCVISTVELERYMTAAASIPLRHESITCGILLSILNQDVVRILTYTDRCVIVCDVPCKTFTQTASQYYIHPQHYLFFLHCMRHFNFHSVVYVKVSNDDNFVVFECKPYPSKDNSVGMKIRYWVSGKVAKKPPEHELQARNELLFSEMDCEVIVYSADLIRALQLMRSVSGKKEVRIEYNPKNQCLTISPYSMQQDANMVIVPVLKHSGSELKAFVYLSLINSHIFRIYQALRPEICRIRTNKRSAAIQMQFDNKITFAMRAYIK